MMSWRIRLKETGVNPGGGETGQITVYRLLDGNYRQKSHDGSKSRNCWDRTKTRQNPKTSDKYSSDRKIQRIGNIATTNIWSREWCTSERLAPAQS